MDTFSYGNPSASVVLIQPVDDHDMAGMENEVKEIRRLSCADFCLIAFKVDNWNQDLSPWASPAVFGKNDFGAGAKDTLEKVLKLCTDKSKTYIIGGYSLAALFSLWAAYQTPVFSAVAAASPSIWFPGFTDYMEKNEILAGKVYLSLGDREEKTGNRIMATVGSCIRKAHEILSAKGIDCTLEWNAGNHFKDPDLRTARAFSWVLSDNGNTH